MTKKRVTTEGGSSMSLEDIIKNKYGSVDSMLQNTDQVSRAYLYGLINGSKTNPTKDILKELSRLLDLSIEEVIKLLDKNEAKEI